MSFTDFLPTGDIDPPPSVFPPTDLVLTGPGKPFISTDENGNMVMGAPVIASSFAGPKGNSLVVSGGLLLGDTKYPPPSGGLPLELPVLEVNGLGQSTSVLVSDYASNPVFYATSNTAPQYTGRCCQCSGISRSTEASTA